MMVLDIKINIHQRQFFVVFFFKEIMFKFNKIS